MDNSELQHKATGVMLPANNTLQQCGIGKESTTLIVVILLQIVGEKKKLVPKLLWHDIFLH